MFPCSSEGIYSALSEHIWYTFSSPGVKANGNIGLLLKHGWMISASWTMKHKHALPSCPFKLNGAKYTWGKRLCWTEKQPRKAKSRKNEEQMKPQGCTLPSLALAHSKETHHEVWAQLVSYLLSLPDYPHKYGSEGGCADHSVFERMRKYQASAVEQPANVRACIPAKPPKTHSPAHH